MLEKEFPSAHFYDQGFVDLYDKMWNKIKDFWQVGTEKNGFGEGYFARPEGKTMNQVESLLSTFFLVYSNGFYDVHRIFDAFYAKQEANGAIRANYDIQTGKAVFTKDNPLGLSPPLFAVAEYNLFHKVGNKKRLVEIIGYLEKHFQWVVDSSRKENGLYSVPLSATTMDNSPREGVVYPIDFNCQMAISALYLSAIADVLNDKEMAFKYKRHFFSLKTKINNLMWNADEGFYFDLDADEKQVKVYTIASYWSLLAEIPNEDYVDQMIEKLEDPNYFAADHPFPTLAACDPNFSEDGNGYCGSVVPALTYMVIKGLEKYKKYELARECAIRHLYFVIDTLHLEGPSGGDFFEGYKPNEEGAAVWIGGKKPAKNFIGYLGLSAITLMFENVLGLTISLPKKTVEWIIPTMEIIGIENLSLKKNKITILSRKSGRGWEIRLESDKLYYLTIRILDENKDKTLPILSGKCSILIDKL